MKKEYEYMYPKEELDEVIEKMGRGIICSIPDDMRIEVKIREQEIRKQLFDDDDDDDDYLTEEDIRLHKEMMEKKLEESRHKAHKEDIKVFKIGPKARERIKQSVSVSLVRPEVSEYVKSDEELYSSDQERKLKEKMSRVKVRYQNPIDFKNAMEIIREYVDFKIREENRNKSEAEIYEAFHSGKIKLNIRLPKLFSDFVHEITDPKILADIAEGNVTLKTKDEVDDDMIEVDYSDSPLVDVLYEPIDGMEYRMLKEEIDNGGRNILTPITKGSKGVFRYQLPPTNQFSRTYGKKKNEPIEIQDGINYEDDEQVQEYINKIKGFEPDNPNNIVEILNRDNNRNLSADTRTRITSTKTVNAFPINTRQDYIPINTITYTSDPTNQRTVEYERSLLDSISANNYNPY